MFGLFLDQTIFWLLLGFNSIIKIINHGMIFNWIMMFELIKFYTFNSFVELRFQISFNPECIC